MIIDNYLFSNSKNFYIHYWLCIFKRFICIQNTFAPTFAHYLLFFILGFSSLISRMADSIENLICWNCSSRVSCMANSSIDFVAIAIAVANINYAKQSSVSLISDDIEHKTELFTVVCCCLLLCVCCRCCCCCYRCHLIRPHIFSVRYLSAWKSINETETHVYRIWCTLHERKNASTSATD